MQIPTLISKFLASGQRGLERENLRLDPQGHLSTHSHFEILGVAPSNPHLTLDFAESQLELVTPAFATLPELMTYLQKATEGLQQKLGSETLWSHSMPPLCKSSDIRIAYFGDDPESQQKYIYRQGLCHRYGKNMQIICGIHYNVSFDPQLFQALSLNANEAYFKIIRNFYRFYPLLIYLFGASPFCHENSRKAHIDDSEFLHKHGDIYIGKYATSLRQSELGYFNPKVPELDICYKNLNTYLKTLERAISTIYEPYLKIPANEQLNSNYLQIEGEHYAPIRPKADPTIKARPITALNKAGVHYIEVRVLDLNPLLPLGVDIDALAFIDLFLMYCLFTDEENLDCFQCKNQALNVAKFGRQMHSIVNQGLDILATIKTLMTEVTDPMYQHAWEVQYKKLQNINLLPSSQILQTKRFT